MQSPSMLLRTVAGGVSVAAMSLALAQPVLAQTVDPANDPPVPPGDTTDDSPSEGRRSYDMIVVTGSRILRPNLTSAVPVTTVGAEQFQSTGNVSVGDVLNELPSLRDTYGQGNSTRFIGTAGLNLLDLRGLDISRTLVLVNGKRHVPASEGGSAVDVNTIPTDLIERVDVVTGGTSAVYGSDAIAGVVNFILKQDFEGIQARGQSGISSRGDRATQFVSLTAGTNFADDRGNIAVSAEFANADGLYLIDRPKQSGAFSGRTQFNLREPQNNEDDGIPDRLLFRGVRSALSSEGGTFVPFAGSNSNSCATPQACLPINRPRIFRFQPDGSLREANYGTMDFRPFGSGNNLGGDGSTLRRWGQFQPDTTRYAANLLAHFDISDAFTPYVEAKYVRLDVKQESSPTFASANGVQGSLAFTTNSQGIPISLDNPFLTNQARGVIQSLLPEGTTAFRLSRQNFDLGTRQEEGRRETYRIVGGVRGDFNDDWHYDVSVNYGRFKEKITSLNNRVQQRFQLAVDAAVNGSGQIVCRSQLPGVVTATPDNPADAAALASDIANCRPLNLFGEGAPDPAAVDYVNEDTRLRGWADQFVVSGFLSGDSSQWFELPGGPIGFSVGAEYRREDAFLSYGELTSQGRTFLTAIADFDPPTNFEVKEAFAELNVPILKERPFFHELSLQGAARVADYKGATGTVLAWNAGATYAPVRDLRFRVNYAVAVRAPNLADLYETPSQNFEFVDDPCDVLNVENGSSTRAANCVTAGIPAGFENFPARQSSTSYLEGGNPDLREERSKSLTIGAIFQPSFLPGFSLSVDYFDIEVENVISAPTVQQVVDNCYDSSDLENIFCPLITRDPATNFFAENGILVGGVNYAARTARGIDWDASYQRRWGDDWSGSLRVLGTYALERNDYPFLDDPDFPDRLLGEVGDPRWQFNVNASLKKGPFTLGYQMRYIGRVAVSSVGSSPGGGGIEDIISVGGEPPLNPDFADRRWLPDAFYHDIRLGYEVNTNVDFYLGVDNVGDRLPSFGILGNGSNYDADAVYDNIGRYFYAGAVVKF